MHVPIAPRALLWMKTGILAAVVTMHAGSVQGKPGPQTVFGRTSPVVFELHVLDANGEARVVASALSLGGGRFVTRCESAWTAPAHTIHVRKGTTDHIAQLEARDVQNALCQLVVHGADAPAATKHRHAPEIGDTIYAVSNGLGLGIGISEGVVSAIRDTDGQRRIQFSAPISPGSEGGGLFDDRGELIGMIEDSRREGQNINFAIDAGQLDGIAARAAATDAATREQEQLAADAGHLLAERNWNGMLDLADRWAARYGSSVDARIAQAQANEGLNRAAAAEERYRAALALDPAHRQAAYGLCRTLVRQQKAAEAIAAGQHLTANFGNDLEAWLMLAYSQWIAGLADDAETTYRRAQQLNPWSLEALDGLASIAARRGDTAALLDYRRRAVNLAQNDPDTVVRLADAYLASGKPAQALELIVSQGPSADTDGDLLYYRGRALSALGLAQESTRILRLSLEHKPRSPDWVWAAIGENAYTQQRWQEAISAFREAVSLSPDTHSWRWQLGLTLKDAAYFDEAMEIFKAWSRDFPDDPGGWRQTGFIHALMARHADAATALEHAASIDPAQIQVWQGLVEVYYSLGRHEDVRRAYGRLRELDRERADLAYRCCIVPLEATQ